MTPAHASPEQVRGDVITTASDIYVLGVLLYELLCGRRPFQLLGASLLEMERIICEQEAPTPSEMVARTARESPELLTDIVACRSTTPARLQKYLRGDVDNIVGMAMRKDAERRYSSAEQLAADLERHLGGKPVLASKDTWLYRTRKFVGRHTARGRRVDCGDRHARGVRDDHVRAGAAHRVRARRRHDRAHARRAGLVVPRRAVRALRSVAQPRQPGHGARAARHRRAARQPRARRSAGDARDAARHDRHACTRVSVCTRTRSRCWKKG